MAATFNLCKKLIQKYKQAHDAEGLADIAEKIDVYYAANRLTEQEYNQLQAML